jgi:hypothetical protein
MFRPRLPPLLMPFSPLPMHTASANFVVVANEARSSRFARADAVTPPHPRRCLFRSPVVFVVHRHPRCHPPLCPRRPGHWRGQCSCPLVLRDQCLHRCPITTPTPPCCRGNTPPGSSIGSASGPPAVNPPPGPKPPADDGFIDCCWRLFHSPPPPSLPLPLSPATAPMLPPGAQWASTANMVSMAGPTSRMDLIDCVDDYGINNTKIVSIFLISPFTSGQGATLTPILPMLGHSPPISLCPSIGDITDSLVNFMQSMGQRGG